MPSNFTPPPRQAESMFIDDDMDDLLATIDLEPPRRPSPAPFALTSPTTSLAPPSTQRPAPPPVRHLSDDGVLDLTNISAYDIAASSPDDLRKLLLQNQPPPQLAAATPAPVPTSTAPAGPIAAVLIDESALEDDGIEFYVEDEPRVEQLDFDQAHHGGSPTEFASREDTKLRTLREILDDGPGFATYYVSAVINALASRFECVGGTYKLSVVISDETERCLANLSNSLIEGLVGMPAAEFAPVWTFFVSIISFH